MAISDYTIGKPYRDTDRRMGIYRDDLYNPTGNTDMVFVTSMDDVTPIFDGRYNSDCSCCFLGFTHSEHKHIISLARHVSGEVWGPIAAGLVVVDVRPVVYELLVNEPTMYQVWLSGKWHETKYDVFDSEDGALSAAVALRGMVTK